MSKAGLKAGPYARVNDRARPNTALTAAKPRDTPSPGAGRPKAGSPFAGSELRTEHPQHPGAP